MPVGKISVKLTPVALLGPLLVTLIVYLTASPSFGVELLTVLVVTKFALVTVTVASKSSAVRFESVCV